MGEIGFYCKYGQGKLVGGGWVGRHRGQKLSAGMRLIFFFGAEIPTEALQPRCVVKGEAHKSPTSLPVGAFFFSGF